MKSLKILGTDFSIRLADDLEMGTTDGEAHMAKSLIKVAKNEKQYMKRILWHEMMHIVLKMQGYSDLSNDEAFVERLATAIHQIINDNPDLYKEIRTD